ncbi:MAG: ABC transporter permease [Chthoniobacteraceae bacterium]
MQKLAATLDTFGLTWFSPFIRLATGEDPKKQFGTILSTIGAPLLAFALFLVAWSLVARNVQVSFGSIPGPGAVWTEARGMWNEHIAERESAQAFYEEDRMKKQKYLERFPSRTYPIRKYAGPPTYIDQIFKSLQTVFVGFLIASAAAIPLGILCGLSRNFMSAMNPFIQIFKPVSPLAWLPLVMIMVSALCNPKDPFFEKSFLSSAIVVALCSLWTTLINTAIGVASIDKDHLNVARVLKLGTIKKITKIVIPSALPYIFTGLRLSLGVGWMVLIAAEMLAQNPGLGKFVWDMFQNGSSTTLARIMVAVFTIGIIGFILDRIMIMLQQLVSYDQSRAI